MLGGYLRYSNDVEYGQEPKFIEGTEDFRGAYKAYAEANREMNSENRGDVRGSRLNDAGRAASTGRQADGRFAGHEQGGNKRA